MLIRSKVPLAAILLVIGSASLRAQSVQPRSSAEDNLQTRQVWASVAGGSIRFTSLGELIQMRLEVIGSTGEVLFDSGFKSGNLIDWSVSDKQGRRVADGSYLCVVTVKDSSSRITRKHAIGSLRDESVSLKQADSSLLTTAQATGTTPDEDSSLTIIEPGQSSATAILAHDGSTAHLVSGSGGLSISSGDFFANQVTEQIRLTAEGNLGIGVSNAQTKLDVAGYIRTSQGIVFPDGTIQYSAASKTLGASSTKAEQNPIGAPSQSITGRRHGKGDVRPLTDGVFDVNASGGSYNINAARMGIGTANPLVRLHVGTGSAPPVTAGATLLVEDGVATSMVMKSTSGGEMFFYQDQNNGVFGTASTHPLGIRTNNTNRVWIDAAGNVGIGTTAPGSALDVMGAVNTSMQYNIGGARMLSAPGSGNVFVGLNAGSANTSGTNNTFVGALAGQSNTVQGNNSFFGNHAGRLTTVGSNSFFGASAGETNSTGGSNAFFGINAGFANSSGSANAFFGASAGNNTSTGSSNAFFGASAGHNNFTGSSLTIVGNSADVNASNLTNATAIGANAFVAQSNSLVLGSINGINGATADTRVGIGTSAPVKHIHVKGAGDQEIAIESSDFGGHQWTLQSSRGSSNGRFEIVDRTAPASRFSILDTGNVGIGTTVPTNRLHVVASVSDSDGIPGSGEHVALIENTNTGEGQGVLALKTDVIGDPIFTDNYITFFKANDASVGAIEGNGSGGVQFVGPGNDYAEWLPRLDPAEQIQPGEIVGLYGGHITKNTRGAAQVMALSTGSIVAGNDPGKDARGKYDLVAFIGQVRTRVRGTVQAGDFIVASGLGDGIGVGVSPECITSEQFEQVVGQAWETSADSGVKSVRIAVGLIHRDPTVSHLLEFNRQQSAQIAALKHENTTLRRRSDALDARLTAIEVRMKKSSIHKATTKK